MRKVLFSIGLGEEHLSILKEKFRNFEFVQVKDKQDIMDNLGDAEVFIASRCTEEMLDAAPKLRWIQVISAGVDSLPLGKIKDRGIILTNGRGIHRIHMSEYAIAAMINLARGFHVTFKNQVKGKWDSSVPQGEIFGSTLGIIGLGSIGEEIAKKAAVFGVRVIAVKTKTVESPYVEKVYPLDEMEEVFRRSDYVISLLPATRETHKLIGKKYFDVMKPTACFINMGRGTAVNEEDLIEALKNKKFRAMVSDVFYQEPLPENSELWELDNVILTPHICGISPQYMERAMEIIIYNLEHLNNIDEMINRVDLVKGY